MSNASSADLVSLARRGDQDAYAAVVFEPHERQIYSFVYRMMGDADDAYDLTQDCFVKAYKAIGRTSEDLNVSAWLHRIASNACLDVLRRRQRLRWLPWEGPKHDHLLVSTPIDDPERSAISQETRLTVQRVLAKMSHRHRLALILREYEGLSCEEIGEVMGMSRSAVKSMLFRARDEFRRVYAIVEATDAGRPPTPLPPPSSSWCPEDDAILRAGRAAGESWRVIGRRLNRSSGRCYDRAMRLGLVVPVRKAVSA